MHNQSDNSQNFNDPFSWEEPDFTDPEYGGNNRRNNDHNLKKFLFPLAVMLVAVVLGGVFLFLRATRHTHVWMAATCLAPKTCETCGETEGALLDHMMLEATCTSPRICQICGETEGVPLGHNMRDATSTSPAFCADCGLEEGRSLGYPLVRCRVLEDTNHPGGQGDILLGNWQDTSGGIHKDSLRFWVANFGNFNEEEYIRYDLGGSFTQLDLTMAPEKESAPNTRSKIYIYSGTELLYESVWITRDMAPVFDTVTFPPCDELTILCVTDSPAYHYCIVNAILYN